MFANVEGVRYGPIKHLFGGADMAAQPNEDLTERQRAILEFIVAQQQTRGFPPSVREIGEAVGLTS
ncbi:MAG: LexA binding domain, partial [Actinomycetota bacterium]